MPESPESPSEHRLHPSSLLFTVGDTIKAFIFPLIMLIVFSKGDKNELWYALAVVPVALHAGLNYFLFRYRFDVDELVVRGGILTRYERHVPYGRIQNIDITQNLVHRLAGVAQIKVETASGKEPEAEMKVISLEAVEEMRRRVFAGRDPSWASKREDAAEPHGLDEATPVYEQSTRDLVMMGLLSNRGLVLVAMAQGVAYQTGLGPVEIFERLSGMFGEENLARIESMRNAGLATQVLGGAAVFVALFFILKILSLVWIVIRFYGFKLGRRGEDLRLSFGLFTKLSATLPRRRIQVLGLHEGMLQRRLGRAEIRAQSAGAAQGEGGNDRSFLAPLVSTGEVEHILSEVQPELEIDSFHWKTVPMRSWQRVVKLRILIPTLLCLWPAIAWSPMALAVLPLVWTWAYLSARGFIRNFRYGIGPNAFAVRRGWLGRRTGYVLFSRIQSVAIHQTPFDRRWEMATIAIDTAGGRGAGASLNVSYLESEVARDLFERLHAEVARRKFVWN